MPEKIKFYNRVKFTPEVIKQVVDAIEKALHEEEMKQMFGKNLEGKLATYELTIQTTPDETWTYEGDNEDEYFADYRKGFLSASITKTNNLGKTRVRFSVDLHEKSSTMGTRVAITMPTRNYVERVSSILESQAEACRIPAPESTQIVAPTIFIAHGRDMQWRDLKDHLQDKQGLQVEAYETGARAGRAIKEILDEMQSKSSFAILVMTGEDQDASGEMHPRDNVIHELGLFQARLGWNRSVILLENSVREFGNIAGTQQIRFDRGNIQATFGEILATIRREFGSW